MTFIWDSPKTEAKQFLRGIKISEEIHFDTNIFRFFGFYIALNRWL